MNQFDLDGGGHYTINHLDYVEHVMKVDGCAEGDIGDNRHHLPLHLHKANDVVVISLLGGQYQSFSIPRWENLPSGHQRYPLKGLNLGYMYWGQKNFSEKIETYQYIQKKVVHVLMFFFLV